MIKIIDNFFSKNDLKSVQDFASYSACYTPQFFENAKEKNKESYFGDRYYLDSNVELLNKFKEQAESKFNIKIKKIHNTSGIDQRNLDHFKPHIDSPHGKINILIMLKGINSITNGTVFFDKDNTNYDLNINVGFKENRAILFPSNHYHSQYASDTPNMIRFTASLFIEDYEEL